MNTIQTAHNTIPQQQFRTISLNPPDCNLSLYVIYDVLDETIPETTFRCWKIVKSIRTSYYSIYFNNQTQIIPSRCIIRLLPLQFIKKDERTNERTCVIYRSLIIEGRIVEMPRIHWPDRNRSIGHRSETWPWRIRPVHNADQQPQRSRAVFVGFHYPRRADLVPSKNGSRCSKHDRCVTRNTDKASRG